MGVGGGTGTGSATRVHADSCACMCASCVCQGQGQRKGGAGRRSAVVGNQAHGHACDARGSMAAHTAVHASLHGCGCCLKLDRHRHLAMLYALQCMHTRAHVRLPHPPCPASDTREGPAGSCLLVHASQAMARQWPVSATNHTHLNRRKVEFVLQRVPVLANAALEQFMLFCGPHRLLHRL